MPRSKPAQSLAAYDRAFTAAERKAKRKPRAKRPAARKSTPLAPHSVDCFYGQDRVVVTIPIRTKSEQNCRDHWRVLSKRKRLHHAVTAAALSAVVPNTRAWIRSGLAKPLRITMTRLGPRPMDSDGAVSGSKYCRDEIARWLAIDDGDDSAATWEYAREIAPHYGVRVEIAGARAC